MSVVSNFGVKPCFLKSAEQQSVLMLHRTRELLVRQRTMLVNALRGHCGEFGIVAAQGLSRAGDLIKRIEDPADTALPDLARQALQCLTSQIRAIQEQIAPIEKKLLAWHSSCEASRRLAEIPGVGLITATAVVASVGNATQFRSARQFAAWQGASIDDNAGRAEAVVGADLARSADPDLCRRLSCSRGLSSAGHRPGTADAQRHAAESPYRRRALTSTADACLERRSSMNNPARNVGLLSRPSRQSLRCRFSARHHGGLYPAPSFSEVADVWPVSI